MPIINPTLPTIGQPNSTEDADIVSAFTSIINAVNGLDDTNFVAANKDGLATLASLRTLGTGSTQAAPGNRTYTVSIPIGFTFGGSFTTSTTILGLYVPEASNEALTVSGYKAKVGAGTATIKFTADGSDITGFTGISLTTSAATATPTAQALSNGQLLRVVVTAASTASDLEATLWLTKVVSP